MEQQQSLQRQGHAASAGTNDDDNNDDIPLIDLPTHRDTAGSETNKPPATSKSGQSSTARTDEADNYELRRRALYKYARIGDVPRMRDVLRRQPELLNEVGVDRLTVLQISIRHAQVEAVEELLKLGADVNIIAVERNLDGTAAVAGPTALHFAAKHLPRPLAMSLVEQRHRPTLDKGTTVTSSTEHVDDGPTVRIVTALIRHGALLNALDQFAMTALHYAAMLGHVEVVRLLLEAGAHVEIPPGSSAESTPSPLVLAASRDQLAAVKLLLKYGANRKRTDGHGNTALHHAALAGNLQLIDVILKGIAGTPLAGELLRLENHDGKTATLVAVHSGNADALRLLLDSTPETDDRDSRLLHVAARQGAPDVVELLLAHGAQPGAALGEHNRVALFAAAQSGCARCTQLILEADRSQLEAEDSLGQTPLLLAALLNKPDAVRVLLEAGASPEKTDLQEWGVIYKTCKYGALDSLKRDRPPPSQHMRRTMEREVWMQVRRLVNRTNMEQMTPLHIASINGFLPIIMVLEEAGAVLDAVDEDEATALHGAAMMGRLDVVEYLVERMPRLVLMRDEDGLSALHRAAQRGHDAVVETLLRAGAEPNVRALDNRSALDMAVLSGHLACVHVLLDGGAAVEPPSQFRSPTPLHLAAEQGHAQIVEALLAKGAQIDRVNLDGRTAFKLALTAKHRDVVVLFMVNADFERVLRVPDPIQDVWKQPAGVISSPLRDLIQNFPDIAAGVFTRWMTPIEEERRVGIRYQYELLEDLYELPAARGEPNDNGGGNPWNEQTGQLSRRARPKSRALDKLYSNHVLHSMVNHERLSLLQHPLVRALLKHKWNSLGRYVYYSALSLYIIYLLLFTTYLCSQPAPTLHLIEGGTAVDMTCVEPDYEHEMRLKTCKTVILALTILQLIKELFQCANRRLSYFTNWENWLEILLYSSSIMIVLDLGPCIYPKPMWQWMVASGTVFVAWLNLLLLLRKLPRFGIYIVMFGLGPLRIAQVPRFMDIVRTFIRFFFIFALFVIAFSVSFFLLFQNKPEFGSLSFSFVKTTVMMIGEFEYTSLFHPENQVFAGAAAAYPLFVIFIILITILLMNLLVGLAVDDIKGVQEQAELRRLSMQVHLVLAIECAMLFVSRYKLRAFEVVCPQERTSWKRILSWFGMGQSEQIDDYIHQTTLEAEKERMVVATLERQERALAVLQANVDVLHKTQQDILQKLERIASQQSDQPAGVVVQQRRVTAAH